MDAQAVDEKIRAIAAPAIAAAGVELVDVEIFGQAKRLVVRVTIDRPEGVGVEDCARFSRHLSDLLDVHDVIEPSYVLEVSSPGLDRPLKKPSDFKWAVGKRVKVTTRRPIDGENVFTGLLADFEDETVTLDIEGETVKLAISEVAKARLDVGDPFGRRKS